jgi:hypothetical protein
MVYSAPQQQKEQKQQGGQPIVIVFTHGRQNLPQTEEVSSYSYFGNGLLRVVRAQDGMSHYIHMVCIDLSATIEANRQNGFNFIVPGYQIGAYDSMLDVRGDGSQYPVNGFTGEQERKNWEAQHSDKLGQSTYLTTGRLLCQVIDWKNLRCAAEQSRI